MNISTIRQQLREQSGGHIFLMIGAILFSFVVLGLLVYRERVVFLNYDWQLRWHFIVQGFLVFTVALFLAALVWADTMRAMGSTLSIWLHVYYYCISHVAKRIPGTVWYVASRGLLYKKHDEPMLHVSVATGIEFVITFFAGALVSLAAVSYSLIQISQRNILSLVGIILLGLLLVHPNCVNWVLKKRKFVDLPKWNYIDIIRWLIGYVVIYILGGVILFLIGNAVVPIDVKHLPYIISIWSFIATLSVVVFFLPSNLGFNEVGLSLLLSAITSSSLAVLIAILTRFLIIIYELIALAVIVLLQRILVQNKTA